MTDHDQQNLPVNLYDAEQCRKLDEIAIDQFSIPGIQLMRRAAESLFQALRQRWPQAHDICICVGTGNNGGDGYLLAGLLKQRGFMPFILRLGNKSRIRGDALIARQFALAQGVSEDAYKSEAIRGDVIVDGLLGTGFDRKLSPLQLDAIETMNRHSAGILSIDVPSGLNGSTGAASHAAVQADCTVTFIGLKQGLLTGAGPNHSGDVIFASLDVPDAVYRILAASDLRSRVTRLRRTQPAKLPRRQRDSHKGSHGKVVVVGGDKGFGGAALLAAEAAARCGAGLTSLITRPEHVSAGLIRCPEIMCRGVLHPREAEGLLASASVIVIGPGLGQSDWAEKLMLMALSHTKTPLLVDADGLNWLAKQSRPEAYRRDNWVLTPHPGEAARLLNCPNHSVQDNRFTAASQLQQSWGGTWVLKGAGSIVVSGDIDNGNEPISQGRSNAGTKPENQQFWLNSSGNPGMAVGGMGDVLSGVIGALMAQGLTPSIAAQEGVRIHGLAADLAAQQGGERGLLATDLMPHLRRLVNP